MAVRIEQPDESLVEAVCSRVHDSIDDPEAARVEQFVRQYYRWVPTDEVADRSPLDLYGAALSHWNLLRRRRPGEARLRIYNPQFEEHGWQSTHTAIEIVTDDMPFLVDSVSMALNRRGYNIHLLIHPVMRVSRGADGDGVDVLPISEGDGVAESVIHVEVDRRTEPEELEALREDLQHALQDVRLAVEDWSRMSERARQLAVELRTDDVIGDRSEREEAAALLDWLDDGHFVFLGYGEYELAGAGGDGTLQRRAGVGLGVLREEHEGHAGGLERLRSPQDLGGDGSRLLLLTKSNLRSTVHRPGYLERVAVTRFDEHGSMVGERRFVGLYTTAAYRSSTQEIPILRRKTATVLERSGLPPDVHDAKRLLEILETFPREELFHVAADELFEIATGILALGERHRVRLFAWRDELQRYVSCLVFIPRDRYNTQNRERIQEILRAAYHADAVDFTPWLTESVLVRIHFVVRVGDRELPQVDLAELESRIVEQTRRWTDALHKALVDTRGEEVGSRLHRRYADAFSGAYQADWLARSAVADILTMERLRGDQDMAMRLYRPLEADPHVVRCRLVRCGGAVSLSDVLPMFEDAGLEVTDERPYEVRPRDRHRIWIYDFGLRYVSELELDAVAGSFEDTFGRVWQGEAESDGFNELVLGAGLRWREVTVVRAIAAYLRQAGTTFSDRYMQRALVSHPGIARTLVELFQARFDPAVPDNDAAADVAAARVERAIDEVESLDEDRILRNFLSVIRATLRTNFFQTTDDGGAAKPYLSLKLDSARIPLLPAPRPQFEIFVYSPRLEAVHLRGGKVARGGLRWSDRHEDFRTEVLGLMKAQMVKNAVIVPVGAKGGFVVKRPPAGDRDALSREVVACYRIFISGLLDLTDNISGDEIVGPPDVVRYDDDDPYLVVAADKGTATFSDIANAVAAGYGFWLGDAFASGGSAGYDHKRMGITARGAWESVKRHFWDLGVDIQSEPFTVAGIGDMSGDVFGNGMLLSEQIRLVAAFDHRHIFLDPDPDAAASLAERRRLFALERSSWADYDAGLVSEGGGVWPRSAKSIRLGAPAQRSLGVEADALTPQELIQAILRAPVDLLWNGGIGTYVKASDESHLEVGDKANDAVRVDGRDLRCKVVGEGGNLGFTQRGRVEYALNGGAINTDAIDNQGGVNCSDREVNIKILLGAVVDAQDMTRKQRDQLLVEMTDEVAALVLADHRRQVEALIVASAQAESMVDVRYRFSRQLEQSGKLDRELEALPDADEVEERRRKGVGLTRPEFAVLLAYSKLTLYWSLVESDLPDDDDLAEELARYFPGRLADQFGDAMRRHRLRREIIATQVTNAIMNRAGATFAFRMREDTGAPEPDIARAYIATRELFAMPSFWDGVDELGHAVAPRVQIEMLLGARKLLERGTRWILRNRGRPLGITATIGEFAEGVTTLAGALPGALAGDDFEVWNAHVAELTAADVPRELAEREAGFRALFYGLDIIEVARDGGHPVLDVAALHFSLAARLRLDWVRNRIAELPRDDRWSAMARAALRDDLYSLQRDLTADVLASGAGQGTADQRIDAWLEARRAAVERALGMIDDIRSAGAYDLTTLPVAVRQVRAIIDMAARTSEERVQAS